MKLLVILILSQIYWQDTIVVQADYTKRFTSFTFPYNFHYINLDIAGPDLNGLPGIVPLLGANYGTITLGGTTPEENTILLNGIPLTDPQSGYTDITLLPRDMISGIELIHSGSVFSGSNGIGGIVNLLPSEGGMLGIRLGKYRRSFFLSPLSTPKINFSFYYEAFPDSFSYQNEFNKEVYYRNTKYTKKALYWRSNIIIPFSFIFLVRESGAPGPEGSILTASKEEKLYGFRITKEIGKILFSLSGNEHFLKYIETDNIDTHRTRAIYTHLKYSWVYCGLNLDEIVSTKIEKRWKYDAYFKLEKSINLRYLDLNTHLRLDHFQNFNMVPTWSLSLYRKFGRNMFFFVNFSSNFRSPTFNELYWPEDRFAAGNSELKPEYSKNIDAGLRMLLPNIFITLSLYHKNIKNKILWTSNGKWIPKNFSRLKTAGIEWEISWETQRWFSIYFSGNLLRAYENDKPFIYRPNISYLISSKILNLVKLQVSYVGERPARLNSPKKLPAFYLINMNVEKNITFKKYIFLIKFGIENILDCNYEIIRGYPQPGREFFLNLNIKRGVL